MAIYRSRWLSMLLLLLACQVARAADELTLAIEPFLSARALVGAFQPLCNHLGDKTGKKVVAITAANYDQYAQRLLNQEFDIAIIGPHTALLAAQKANYLPLLKGEGFLKALMIVDKNSTYQRPADLKGQTIALPDHLTMTSMLGAEFFRPADAAPIDVRFRYNDFHNTAALMMLRGEAAAAVVADSALLPMSMEIRENIRIIAESKQVPQMVMLVHSRVPTEMRDKLHDAMYEYIKITAPQKNFLARVGFSAAKPLTEQDSRQLAPYVEELKRRLGP
mgnify:FL=1